MRLDEIEQGSGEEQRVKRLKDTARAAKDKAKQLTTQANQSAALLKVQKTRRMVVRLRGAAAGATIKPHA